MRRLCALFLTVLFAAGPCLFAEQSQAPQAAPATSAPTEAVPAAAQDKPRIFVTDEPLHEGNAVVRGEAAAAHVEKGPSARVVEIQADLVKVCPHVTVTNRQDMADFTLLFRRHGGQRAAMFAFGGLAGLALSATSKVDGASLFAANGDLVTATRQRTVENAIREICTAIPMTVAHAAPQPAPVAAPSAQQPAAALEPAPDPALAPIAPPLPPSDTPPPPAKTISVGQTRDEVVATFGQPQKVVKLTAKEMLYYPDMKVTLVNAKVTDVQ